jgi:putative PEP-CTERM system TPR-repeat lipoprotein
MGNPLQAEEALATAEKLGADPVLTALPLAQARNRLHKYDDVVDSIRPGDYPPGIQADLWVELAKARLGQGDGPGADAALAHALRLAPNNEQALLTQIRSLLRQKKNAEAIAVGSEVLALYPQSAEAWFLMGSAHHAQGEYDSAAAHYRRAREIDPAQGRAALGEAMVLIATQQAEAAAPILADLRISHPYSMESHYYYFRVMQQLGRTEQAAEALDTASDLVNRVNPSDLDDPGHLRLASTIKFETGEYEGAFAFLTRYLEFRSEDSSANKQLARLHRKLGRPSDASRLLTRLKIKNPQDPELLIMLGDVNADLHDFEVAERYYQAARELLRDSPEIVQRIGLTQYRQGDADSAVDTLKGFIEQHPGVNAESSVLLARLYLREGRLTEAAQLVNSVVSAQPDNLAARDLQAVLAISAGDRQRGRQRLQAILNEDPGFHPARINLVRLDIIEGHHEAASQVLQQMLARDANDQAALVESARLAAARNDPEVAIRHLQRVLELDPDAFNPTVELMKLYLTAGRPDDAVKLGLGLEDANPTSVTAKLALAEVWLARDNPGAANNLLGEAARLASRDPEQLAGIAALQLKAGAVEGAEQSLRRALQGQPDSVSVRLKLATLLARQRRLEEAAEEVNAVLATQPNNPLAISILADVRLAQGRTEEAVTLYRRVQSISDTPRAMIRLYRGLVRAGQADQALMELQGWHDKNPDLPAVMRLLAEQYQRRGDTAKALELYTRITEVSQASAGVYNNIAYILLEFDVERAVEAATKAYDLAPTDAAVLDTLGWALVQVGELDRGLVHLREALSRNSRVPSIRYHLAVALEEYGNRGEARSQLERALAMRGYFPEREEAVVRLERLRAR